MKAQPTRGAFAVALLCLAAGAQASSHREAPFITTVPKVDATDFYMFRSYETGRDGYVTLIANYLPLQDGYGGPNYFKLDPAAVYEIHVSNDGGARENLTFQFRFQQQLADNALTVGGKQVAIPLVQNGSKDVSEPGSSALNVTETYTVDVIRGLRRSGALSHATHGATCGDRSPARAFAVAPASCRICASTSHFTAKPDSYANGSGLRRELAKPA